MDDRLATYIDDHRPQMFDVLKQMVGINSGSRNKAGVDAMGRLVADVLADCRLAVEVIGLPDVGNPLVFRGPCPAAGVGQVLLAGHLDTVFAEETGFSEYREDDARAYGPGVIDMKGGLVAGIFALKAIASLGLMERLPLAFLFTGDEEIGSRGSRPVIDREAGRSRCAFVLEAGGLDGEVVTGRKGNLSARLTVEGHAGHAAFAGTGKASALVEMAHTILAVEALNDPAAGITANVGTVTGGIGPNTVPDHAEARLDVRFIHADDGRRLSDRLARICADPVVPGCRATLEVVSGRPPMPASEANRRLYAQVQRVARRQELTIRPEFRAGVSDANFIAQAGIPVLDGLGPIGGGDHSPREFMLKDSLPRRTLLLAGVLADLIEQGADPRP